MQKIADAENFSPDDKLFLIMKSFYNIFIYSDKEIKKIVVDIWSERMFNSEFSKVNLKNIYKFRRNIIIKIVKEGIEKQIFRENIDFEMFSVSYFALLNGFYVQAFVNKKTHNYLPELEYILGIYIKDLKK